MTTFTFVTCVCGKRGYASRKRARHAAQSLKGGGALNAYRCEHSETELWHLGHLPEPIKKGRVDRSTASAAKRKPSETYFGRNRVRRDFPED